MNFRLFQVFIYFLAKSSFTYGSWIGTGCPCDSVSLEDGKTAEISNCILKDCNGITVTGGSRLVLTNVLIHGGMGKDSVFGSFITVKDASQLIVNNGSFVSLRKGISGSAISVESKSKVTINYGVFHNNEASANGGSIAVSGKSLLTCNECFFSGNRALFGGAVDVAGNSSIIWTIGYCKGGRSNAATCLQVTDDSSFRLSQVLIKDNVAIEKVAGIAVSSGSYGWLDNVIFQDNFALIQAADLGIYWKSSVTANNVAFYNSTAGSWAGSTLVHLFSNFYLINGIYQGTYSKGSVGALSVSLQSYASTEKTYFVDSAADEAMGIFYVTRYSGFNATDTIFMGGKAETAGGGWVSYKSWANFQNCAMKDNQAIENGGFLIIDDSDVDITGGSSLAVGNVAYTENGGFALLLSESYVYFSETFLEGNAAYSGCGSTISAFGRNIDAEFGQGVTLKYQTGFDDASAVACWHQDQGFIWFSDGDTSNTLEGAFSIRSGSLISMVRKQRSSSVLKINPAPTFFKWKNRPCVSVWNETLVGPLQVTIFDDFGDPVTPESSGLKNIKVKLDKIYDEAWLLPKQDTIVSMANSNSSSTVFSPGFIGWNKTVVIGYLFYMNSYLAYYSTSKMDICYDIVVSSNENLNSYQINATLEDGFGNRLPPKTLPAKNNATTYGMEVTIYDQDKAPEKGSKFKKYLKDNETRVSFEIPKNGSATYFKVVMDFYPGPGEFSPFYRINKIERIQTTTTTTTATTLGARFYANESAKICWHKMLLFLLFCVTFY